MLGEPIVGLHLTAWKARDTAYFHRRLLRAGLKCNDLVYANALRRDVVATVAEPLESVINTTGHTCAQTCL